MLLRAEVTLGYLYMITDPDSGCDKSKNQVC